MLIVVEATMLCGHIKPTLQSQEDGKYFDLSQHVKGGNRVKADFYNETENKTETNKEIDTAGMNTLPFLPYFARRNNKIDMKAGKKAANDKNIKDMGIAFTSLCNSCKVEESMRPYKTMKEASYVAFVRAVCDGCDMVVVDVREDKKKVYSHEFSRVCHAVKNESDQEYKINPGVDRLKGYMGLNQPDGTNVEDGETITALRDAFVAAEKGEFNLDSLNKMQTILQSKIPDVDDDNKLFSRGAPGEMARKRFIPKEHFQISACSDWSGLSDKAYASLLRLKIPKWSKIVTRDFKYHVLTITHPPCGPAYLQSTDGTGYAFLEPAPCDPTANTLGQWKTYHDDDESCDFWNLGLKAMKIILPGYQKSPGRWKSSMSKYILKWPNLRKLGRSKKWLLCVIPDTGKFYKIDRSFQGGSASTPKYHGMDMYRVTRDMLDKCVAMADVCVENDGGSARNCIPKGLSPASAPFMPYAWIEKAKKCWARLSPKKSFATDSRLRRFQLLRSVCDALAARNSMLRNQGKPIEYMLLVSGDGEAHMHACDEGALLGNNYITAESKIFKMINGKTVPVFACSQDFFDAIIDFNKKY